MNSENIIITIITFMEFNHIVFACYTSITKYQKLGGLNNQNLLSHSSEG